MLSCVVTLVSLPLGSAVADLPGPDPRLATVPVVALPKCGSPNPYLVENWTADVLGFVIVLREGIPASTAQLLAVKHKFEIERLDRSTRRFAMTVGWLNPEQVAALRCEMSVKYIEFNPRVVIDG